MSKVNLIRSDCLEALQRMPENTVDSLVTDPPAGIGFMGKDWDSDKDGSEKWTEWMESVMRECLRVLKPGAHALVWAIPRTSHWIMWAMEKSGFEIRDVVTHLFGQGFPKGLDISKAMDKAARAEGEIVGTRKKAGDIRGGTNQIGVTTTVNYAAPTTTLAKEWQGWGTALKPAAEFWVLARKPLSEKNVASNVERWGTGGINIDGSRIQNGENRKVPSGASNGAAKLTIGEIAPWDLKYKIESRGRFPSHLILDEEAAAMLGEPSRFFYCAKISPSERGKDNKHPTVKSLKLMRYLCKLITPPGGVVLDPFTGSGSTGVAAIQEGFKFIGIEKEKEYFRVAEARITTAQNEQNKGVGDSSMKLELGILAGPETKAFLVDLTKQIDRLEKLASKALSTSKTEEIETSEDEEDFTPETKKKAKKTAAPAFDEDEDETEEEVEETDTVEEEEVSFDDAEEEEKPVAKKTRAKKLTVAEVNDACKTYAKALIERGQPGPEARKAVVKILKKKFDVTSVTDLTEDQYADAIKALKA